MTYSTEQLKLIDPKRISEASKKHIESVVAELVETALLAAPQAAPAVGELLEVLTEYLAAQDALDNCEYMGINAEPYEKLIRSRNYARDALDAALAQESKS